MNLFAWKGELPELLNYSVFVTDGASVGEHAQLRLIDGPCQNKKTEPHCSYRNRICGNSVACCLRCLTCNNLALEVTTMNF